MNRLFKFFYGRYGVDELYKFNFYCYCILLFLNIFIRSRIIFYIEFILLFTLLFRSLSKNINRRKKENIIYLKMSNRIKKRVNNIKKIFVDRNQYLYRKCPKCKTILRLPLKKGKHVVKCPECSNKFNVRCFRNEKLKTKIIK